MLRAKMMACVLMSAMAAVPAVPQSEAQSKTETKAQAKAAASSGSTVVKKVQVKAGEKKQPPVPLNTTATKLVFEPNHGQFPADVQWVARGSGFNVAIRADGATIETHERAAAAKPSTAAAPQGVGMARSVKPPMANPAMKTSTVKMQLAGGNAWKLEGASPTGGISNYFLGKDQKKWHTDIPQYAEAKATGVYKGVDLQFHGSQSALEYDFVVAPGADPKQIQLQFGGAANVHAENGALVMTTSTGKELRQEQPQIYQEAGGKKKSVKGGFQVGTDGKATFEIGDYDRTKPLVIDPTISFVTFLRGSDTDEAYAVTYDPFGNSYTTGVTYSSDFPVYYGFQGNSSGSDAFVTKLGINGNIVFSTYLGGDDYDWGGSIAVDQSGVYLTGSTGSDDFPLKQPMQDQKKGEDDAFVTKLSLAGNSLVYSTYLGGSSGEAGFGITVDATQCAYVAGETNSTDFPTTAGNTFEYFPQSDTEFVPFNGFVVKLSPSGTQLMYSTYLGGNNLDYASSVVVDSSLSAYVTGETCSSDFPYAGFYSEEFAYPCTAFVTKLSPAGNSVLFSTFLGVEANDGTGIALDGSGNIYVAITDYLGQDATGPTQAEVLKLAPTGKVLTGVFLDGDDGTSLAAGIATDAGGDVWLAGSTTSSDFPGAPVLTPNPSAGYLTKLDTNLNLIYTVLLGAQVDGVAVQIPKRIGPELTYPTIFTAGYRFTGGQATSDEDAFVVKLSEGSVTVIGGNE